MHFCCVPNCRNRSDQQSHLSFFHLPLKDKCLLKQWVCLIRRKDLPLHEHTRICSEHFVNAAGRRLRAGEVPSLQLPISSTTVSGRAIRRRSPKERPFVSMSNCSTQDGINNDFPPYSDTATQTDLDVSKLEKALSQLRKDKETLQLQVMNVRFRLANIAGDDSKIAFHTGFPSYDSLKAFYNFLGPAVNNLCYSYKNNEDDSDAKQKRCRPRSLPPLEEFFLTMVRLRLGLMEQDLAYRFGISQPTVSRIISTWINFIYLRLKELPLWPPKDLLHGNMPQKFKECYPTTRVIIDATEIYIEQPELPELQQMTFSNYKNDNTFKGIVGISPDGVVIFVSSLFPGCISDKELTRRCGILDLLEAGDSVMADRGFDINEDLILRGVGLNIPPFMRGKGQLSETEVVTTRRIASLRIHVERAMGRIKSYHIFDRALPATMTNIADRIFYVCCVLTNFQPPLCK